MPNHEENCDCPEKPIVNYNKLEKHAERIPRPRQKLSLNSPYNFLSYVAKQQTLELTKLQYGSQFRKLCCSYLLTGLHVYSDLKQLN